VLWIGWQSTNGAGEKYSGLGGESFKYHQPHHPMNFYPWPQYKIPLVLGITLTQFIHFIKVVKTSIAALDKQIHHSGVVRCVKLGPRSGCLTMTADTQPGMVNSGCPGSRSRHTTSPNTGRLRLTRNRTKVDFPMPFPPQITVHTASSTHKSMS